MKNRFAAVRRITDTIGTVEIRSITISSIDRGLAKLFRSKELCQLDIYGIATPRRILYAVTRVSDSYTSFALLGTGLPTTKLRILRVELIVGCVTGLEGSHASTNEMVETGEKWAETKDGKITKRKASL